MTIVLNILIGILAGGAVGYLGNKIKNSGSKMAEWLTIIVGIILGGLGAVSADQLINYGPTLLDSQFVPAIVGGLVLSFVGVYAGKKWFHLSAQ